MICCNTLVYDDDNTVFQFTPADDSKVSCVNVKTLIISPF